MIRLSVNEIDGLRKLIELMIEAKNIEHEHAKNYYYCKYMSGEGISEAETNFNAASEKVIELEKHLLLKLKDVSMDDLVMLLEKAKETTNNNREYIEEKGKKFRRIDILRELIRFKKEPIASNDKIDLRANEEGLNQEYWIYLHGTCTIIGKISYRGYHKKEIDADLGYDIYKKYQGNGYAYEALVLLGDYLHKHGIVDFWITVEEDNIPSIKIIEKYGGLLLGTYPQNNKILKYECKTKEIELFESEKRGQKSNVKCR